METQEQFLDSLKRTTPFHASAIAVVLGVLLTQARTGPELVSLGLLAIGYTTLIAIGMSPLRRRFKSDAWIYVMIAAETCLFALAFHGFGPESAVIALAPITTVRAGLFLGYMGAGVSVGLLGLMLLPGLSIGEWSIATSLELIAVPTIVIAALASFISHERLVLRTSGHRMGDANSGAMAERILSALRRLEGVSDRKTWSTQIIASVGTATGLGSVGVYFQDGAESAPELEARSELFDTGISAEIDSVLRTVIGAQRKQSVRTIESLESIIPFGSHSAVRGAIVIQSETGTQRVADRVDDVERLITFALPYLERLQNTGSVSVSGPQSILENELAWAGRSQGADSQKRPIELEGISLDPVNEKSVVGDMSISLSRTEFEVLYELASSPGSTVGPEHLASSVGTSTSVDVTIHRLRRKLANAPMGSELIKTVRGKGYMLVVPAVPLAN
ncbi:MAG: response regulator transcription factor [Chloroflexi bacterium]|nr:response regulator transcription factor [Chloroflexota bacterium]